jgi:hypothetical protein
MDSERRRVARPRGAVGSARRLPGVALHHFSLVCGERSQNLPFLLLGHVEEVKRSPELGGDLIEPGGRDPQFAMGFFQAERGTARHYAETRGLGFHLAKSILPRGAGDTRQGSASRRSCSGRRAAVSV